MTLKTKKLDQGTTEMFISEFEKKESLWNVMSKIFKNCNTFLTTSNIEPNQTSMRDCFCENS